MNIGKNAATPLNDAVDDYLECFRIVAPHADYVAMNVSSPNTEGLRQLQEAEQLQPIVERAGRSASRVAGSDRTTRATAGEGIAGSGDWPILRASRDSRARSASTGHRDQHDDESQRRRAGLARASGRVERRVRCDRSPCRPCRLLRAALGQPVCRSSLWAGSTRSVDAQDALAAGADLVQIYTGLIYRGPALVRRSRRSRRGVYFRLIVLTPLSRATISTSAGRRANKPLVTTPAMLIDLCSRPTGSVIFRSCTSRILLPLSVSTPSR